MDLCRYVSKVFAITVLLLVFFALNACSNDTKNELPIQEPNQLNLGETAPNQTKQLSIAKPIDLNGLSFDAVASIRESTLSSLLVSRNYKPQIKTFGRINPKGAWIGLAGYYYVGPTQSAGVGNSFESVPLLNPMLLFIPDFVGVSIHAPNYIKWREKNVTQNQATDPNFPFAPLPQKIKFNPHTRELHIEYSLTDYGTKVSPYLETPLVPFPSSVSFSTYNAADLGFQTFKILPEKSSKMALEGIDLAPTQVKDAIGFWQNWFGSTVGYNHRSRYLKNLQNIPILESGAEFTVGLWSVPPDKISDSAPELVVTISIL